MKKETLTLKSEITKKGTFEEGGEGSRRAAFQKEVVKPRGNGGMAERADKMFVRKMKRGRDRATGASKKT